MKKPIIIKVDKPKIRKAPIKQGSVENPDKGGSYRREKRIRPDEF